MKKVLIFVVLIAVLFVGLYFLNDYSKQARIEGNPFGKDDLHTSTIAQLKDENYQNQILPKELDEKLAAGEDLLVYFYSPECGFCRQATPLLVPTADEVGANVYKLNLLEFGEGWDDYNIQSTPTLISYKGGKEVNRIVGLPDGTEEEAKNVYKQFLLAHEE